MSKLSGDYNTRQLTAFQPVIEQIKVRYEKFEDLTDAELQAKTQEFKERYLSWTSLDDLLPEAFALVKQACRRLVGTHYEVKGIMTTRDMIPYDVQLLWGIVLHHGRIAEMKTGEGKTLVATLPAYLNALSGHPVHIVTVNDYLASRDAGQMKLLYERLGLEVGMIHKGIPLDQHGSEYMKDIIYIENTELWFDYLRDNLKQSIEERQLLNRGLHFAIVDEADSIFIDEARTPMILSQANGEATDKYVRYATLVKQLQPCSTKKKVSKGFLAELMKEGKEGKEEKSDWSDGDYYIDEKSKTATLSEAGITKLEKMLWVTHLYKELGFEEIHHIENAITAQWVYHEGIDYIKSGVEVLIVDPNTGRTMPGRRYQSGLHQAIEAKEGLTIKQEAKTIATITYQNFFKLYKKLSGMTGTATTEWEEFEKIYNLEVLSIPTNRVVIRTDMQDKVYFNQSAKRKAVLETIKWYHSMGQPLLVGTSSIHTSELVSQLLRQATIQHYVLNAKYHEQEATIIANAGKYGSVVVATNMAGRGTDIKLEAGLNIRVADNYAKWIVSQIDKGIWLDITIMSDDELQLTSDALHKVLPLSHPLKGDKKPQHITTDRAKLTLTMNKTGGYQLIIQPLSDSPISPLSYQLHYGLYVLGTEKHESRRIDNQLRGRSGRQWDPGVSQFVVALDDEIMRKMGGEKIQSIAQMLLPKEELDQLELTQSQFTSSILRAQTQMEAHNFSIRKHLFDYDNVINQQRMKIYHKRDDILWTESIDMLQQEIIAMIPLTVEEIISAHEKAETSIMELAESINQEFGLETSEEELSKYDGIKSLQEHLITRATHLVEYAIGKQDTNIWLQSIKSLYLHVLDHHWIDHIDDMHHLRDQVGLYGYAQQDPLIIYKSEGYDKFAALNHRIRREVIGTLTRESNAPVRVGWIHSNQVNNVTTIDNTSDTTTFSPDDVSSLSQMFATLSPDEQANIQQMIQGFEHGQTSPLWWWTQTPPTIIEIGDTKPVVTAPHKIRPNDPCHCGSGKKYKKCHGV